MTLSIMTLSIMTLSIMTISIMKLIIMTHSKITLSIMTLSITMKICVILHNENRHNDPKHTETSSLCWVSQIRLFIINWVIVLNVVTQSVVAPWIVIASCSISRITRLGDFSPIGLLLVAHFDYLKRWSSPKKLWHSGLLFAVANLLHFHLNK